MSFYHTVDDAAETIDYRLMLDTTRYLIRASLAVTDAEQSFPYEGEPALDMAAAQDVRRVLVGVLASSALDDTERQTVQRFVDDVDRVIEAESWDVIGSASAYFIRAVGFVAFQLPAKYPGEVPPPFPQ